MASVDTTRFGAVTTLSQAVACEKKETHAKHAEATLVLPHSDNKDTPQGVQIKNLNVTNNFPAMSPAAESINAVSKLVLSVASFFVTLHGLKQNIPLKEICETVTTFMNTINNIEENLPFKELHGTIQHVLTSVQSWLPKM